MGHTVYHLSLEKEVLSLPRKIPSPYYMSIYAKRFLKKVIFRKSVVVKPDVEVRKRVAHWRKNTDVFIKKNIHYIAISDLIREDFKNADAFIVGSDQVWRYLYTKETIITYFLGFLPRNHKFKRIAYSVSFGSEQWEAPEPITQKCRKLASLFSSISVREKDGICLCRDVLQVKAKVTLDPTMLLSNEIYKQLVCTKSEVTSKFLLTYILDVTSEKSMFVDRLSAFLGLDIKVHPSPDANRLRVYNPDNYEFDYNENTSVPSVEEWLQNFLEAEFIITDSYHGSVFSIMFNKPFVVVANVKRGTSRIKNLLEHFQLSHRFIEEESTLGSVLNDIRKEDWTRVNKILQLSRAKSMQYLKVSLER